MRPASGRAGGDILDCHSGHAGPLLFPSLYNCIGQQCLRLLVLALVFFLLDSATGSRFRAGLADLGLRVSLHRRASAPQVKLGRWLLLAPYSFQAFYIIWHCMKPVLYRTGIIPDPGNLTREFQHINFRPEDFVEDAAGYPSCPIVVDISA